MVQPSGGSFASGVWLRGSLGVGFVLATVLLTVFVEHVPLPTTASATASAPGPAALGLLRMQSTFTVKHWSVSVDGRDILPSRSDTTSWQGPCSAGASLLVQAAPADEQDMQLHALQLRLIANGHIPRVRSLWGNGEVIGSVDLRSP